MSDNDFWNKVREKAYLTYLNRLNNNIPGNEILDWESAVMDQQIEEKIKAEAFLHYMSYGDYALINWLVAQREIYERLNFIAFYLHESDLNKHPLENWKNAQKLYLEKF